MNSHGFTGIKNNKCITKKIDNVRVQKYGVDLCCNGTNARKYIYVRIQYNTDNIKIL